MLSARRSRYPTISLPENLCAISAAAVSGALGFSATTATPKIVHSDPEIRRPGAGEEGPWRVAPGEGLDGGSLCADVTRYAIGIDNHLSELRTSLNRSHADRRLHVLLRMQGLRRSTAAFDGGLLRFLFVWRHAVPADPRDARDRR